MRNFPSTPRPFIWPVLWRSIISLQIRFALLLPVHQPTFRPRFPIFSPCSFAFSAPAPRRTSHFACWLRWPLQRSSLSFLFSPNSWDRGQHGDPGLRDGLVTSDIDLSRLGDVVCRSVECVGDHPFLDCFDKPPSRRRRFSVVGIRLRFAFAYKRQRFAGTRSLARLWELEIPIRLLAAWALGRPGNRSGDVDAVNRPQLLRVSPVHPVSHRFRACAGGIE